MTTLRVRFGLFGLLLVLLSAFPSRGQDAAPAVEDPKLKIAYQRLRFDRLYPAEAVSYIQGKLQGLPRAVEGLAELSQDERPEVRALVAMLLGDLGEPDGAKILWKLTRDNTELVRVTAAGAATRLAQLTPIAASWEGLKDERPEVRRLTAATLRQISGKSAEAALIEVLRDPDETVRMEAAAALSVCGTEAAVPSLAEALRDSSVMVRTAAAGSLGMFKSESSIPVLIEALNDPDWHVRAASIVALSAVAGPDKARVAQIIPPIASKLQDDPYALVRDRAADALARPGDEKAIATLVEAIVSENRDARFHAHEGIIRCRATSALPGLMPYARHPNRDVREKIIRIFGEIGGEEQIPAVTAALSDEDPGVRLAAVQALRKLQGEGFIEALEQKCVDPDPNVRAEAARALGNLGDRKAVPKVMELLRDSNGFVRGAAAEALGKLGDQSATEALIGVLTGEKQQALNTDPNGLVIGSEPGPLPEMAKLKLVEEKIIAAKALGEIRDPASVESLITHGLKAEDAGLRAESAVSLGKIGEQRASKPLEEAVRPYYETAPVDTEGVTIAAGPIDERFRLQKEKESRVRASVAWALGQLGDSSARETLIRAANDENSLVRDAAVEALAKLGEREEKLAAGNANPRRAR